MKLSELHTGERGVIVKVTGHGGFRKRIIEMGFIKGQTVEVLLNAPLQDPVIYRIMGYEVSLRHQEADMIEVVSEALTYNQQSTNPAEDKTVITEAFLRSRAFRERRHLNVALVGNPNCGKTSLFNYASGAHAHVGNYSGVTVGATMAEAVFYGYDFSLTDLPGTYSLTCYSPEELYVRQHLTEQTPDVVINVIDASNLERNLYLTTQLVDMNIRMVCALNMYDEFERRGDHADLKVLSTLLGMPFIPTSFKTGMGVKELFKAVIQVYEGTQGASRHIHINYGHEIENGISHIQHFLKADEHIRQLYSTRYLSIKLLEGDTSVSQYIEQHFTDEHRPEDYSALQKACQFAQHRVKEETGNDAETAIMDAKYGFINGALTEAGYRTGTKENIYRTTHMIDNVLSNKYLGFPIFFLILYVMFQTTFSLGQYPMDWIEAAVEYLGDRISNTMPDGSLRSMLVDGVIGGVGSVIVFLPQILILYFFISIMEDSGYMARAAFIMDRLMHKMGLHGKSFIPLVMGFGCNVPAVMATRTIESRRSRLITMLVLPFMSCSARLPIYIMITGMFFAEKYQSLVMISLYAVGIMTAAIVSNVLSRLVLKGEDTPFVMELPPYRWPTAKAIGRHTWEKGKEYLKKMGGIILVASIIVWALGYYGTMGVAPSLADSFIGRMGQVIEPVFALQGFNWQLDVSLITGIGAKEIVASTMGIIGGFESITPLTAYAYLLFVLLYFPCLATLVAIKHETGSWKWFFTAAIYTSAVAWVVSALFYQIGSLI
jgi:ferrous iron transport protein B